MNNPLAIFLLVFAICLGSLVCAFLYIAFLEPMIQFDKNVPTIPFWVSFISFLSKDADQRDIWAKYIEPRIARNGIAKIYFAGRWNLVVAEPEYMIQLFKHEYKIYQKSGNNEKIPNSLLSYYTGTNIISAHGEQWKKFRKIILPGLLNFKNYDIAFNNSKLFCELISLTIQTDFTSTTDTKRIKLNNKVEMEEPLEPTTLMVAFDESLLATKLDTKFKLKKGLINVYTNPKTPISKQTPLPSKETKILEVGSLVQRLCLANISQVALGFDIETLTNNKSTLYESLSLIKKEIFKPLFMAFPFLDNFPLDSRKKTRVNIDNFKKDLFLKIKDNLIANYKYEQETYLNPAANLIKHTTSEILNNDELLDNLTILLVAGHENPQLLLTSLIYVLAKYKSFQVKLREELKELVIEEASSAKKIELLFQSSTLNSIIYETVRLYPPIGQLVNRKVAKDSYMTSSSKAPIFIKKGTYIGYNNFGLQTNIKIWGADANTFKPSRWGTKINEINEQWKRRKAAAEICAFHGGSRNCLGEEIALNFIRVAIWEMTKRFEWTLDKTWPERFTSAGPISPAGLRIEIQKINKRS